MSDTPSSTPTIKRRLIVMVYETFLLLAVEMLAVALYLLVTRNSHAPLAQHGLKVFLFLVTGAYFVWSWTDSGHTLAMKTWRLRLTGDGQGRVPLRTAVLRYLLAWGWFLPALIVCAAFGLKGKAEVSAAIAIGVAGWALTAFLDKDRQFLHDRLAGTRLLQLPKAAKASKTAAVSPAA
ncbi:hypothetical protein AB595_18000 [Massilia sp. WF1]|uniref:RDD family protein n=1 Tax=unclassified Massilia TaxID=2609279 RepID=UPI000649CEDA|nr:MULTISPECIES: RDD family protein [unclassified Massilia]ALK98148.1 hypothetical protein AM586_20135 [Massilia sp. WG5]KLU35621.1 hypothetical protein AB595_18000 [Massilia sp. WF1]